MKSITKSLLFTALTAWIGLLCDFQVQADSIDDIVRGEMAKRHIPGVALAVVRDGHPVKIATYGTANIEDTTPVGRGTSFQLFSLTKTFTAAAVMRLIEWGQLSLDDTIMSRLQGLPEKWSSITVRDCLSHTSGLPDIIDREEQLLAADWDNALPILAKLPSKKRCEEALYIQTGYVFLRLIIEKVTKKPFEDFMKDEFYDPLQMTSTRYADSRDIVVGRAAWYTNLQPSLDRKGFLLQNEMPNVTNLLFNNSSFFPPMMHGSAGLVSTIDDLLKWECAFANGSILSRSALTQTLMVPVLKDGTAGPFGLGWATATFEGHRFMTFGGGNSVVYIRFPDNGLSIILLTNLQGADPNSIVIEIARRLLANSN
jgi:CubicO group peptidase (beta-lactamase class C family)